MQMTKNIYAGLFALIAGIGYLLGTVFMAEAGVSTEIGPRLFPYIIGSATTVCGVAILYHELRSSVRVPFSFNFFGDWQIWLQILVLSVLGIVYGMVLEFFGYVIATFLFLTCAFSMMNRGRHKNNVIYAVSFAIVTYAVFAIFLELSLPRGLLDFLPF